MKNVIREISNSAITSTSHRKHIMVHELSNIY